MIPVGLTLAVGLAAASLGMAWLGSVAWRGPAKPGSRWFAAMAVAGALWVGSDVLGMALLGPGAVRFWVGNVHSSFGVLAVVCWMGFAITYTGRGHLLTRRRIAALLVVPVATILVLVLRPTSPLVVREFGFRELSGLVLITTDAGPLLLAMEVYYLILVAGIFALLGAVTVRKGSPFAGQLGWLVVGSIAVLAGVAVDVLDVTGFNVLGPSVGVTIAVGCFAVALFRHRLLGLVPAVTHLGEARAFTDLDDGVLIVDESGTVARANPSAGAVLSAKRDHLVGATASEVLPEVDPTAGSDERTIERRGRRYRVTVSDITDHDGGVIGHTVVLGDVTERERREQRLAVLGRVLRHNLRNDMDAIEKHAAYLEREVDGDATESAATIRRLAMRTAAHGDKARRAQAVLDGPTTHSRVDVAAFLAEVRANVDGADRTTVALDVPDGLSITTDADVLRLAVENLLDNAIRHGGAEAEHRSRRAARDGGTLDPNRDAQITAAAMPAGVEIAVADDGPGVPAHEIAANSAGDETQREHGSGLGLWLVHRAVEALGGDVTFETSGDGTTATVIVPDRGDDVAGRT